MTSPTTNGSRFGLSDALMLGTVVIWGINMSFIKIGLRELSPGAFNGWRLLLTAVVFIVLLAFSGEGFRVGRRDLWKLILIGLAGNAVYQYIFIDGINRTSASSTSLILSMSPIFVALLSAVLGLERISRAAWAGIFISFAGLYLVIASKSGGIRFASAAFQGDFLIFIGTILWASYTVFAKPFLETMSPLKFSALTMTFGTAFYLPITARDMLAVRFSDVSWTAWGCLAASSLFALVIGYLAWYSSVKRVGNTRTAIYNNMTPVFTALFAAFLLGESLRPSMALGAAVILFGVWLSRSGYRYFEKRRPANDTPAV